MAVTLLAPVFCFFLAAAVVCACAGAAGAGADGGFVAAFASRSCSQAGRVTKVGFLVTPGAAGFFSAGGFLGIRAS